MAQQQRPGGGGRKPRPENPDTKLFVGNLNYTTTQETLATYFAAFGPILECVVIFDRPSGKSRGFGFVTYETPEAAQAALKDPNPLIDGRRININLAALGAKKKEPRSASTSPGHGIPVSRAARHSPAIGQLPAMISPYGSSSQPMQYGQQPYPPYWPAGPYAPSMGLSPYPPYQMYPAPNLSGMAPGAYGFFPNQGMPHQIPWSNLTGMGAELPYAGVSMTPATMQYMVPPPLITSIGPPTLSMPPWQDEKALASLPAPNAS